MLTRFSFAYGVSQAVRFTDTKKERIVEAFCSLLLLFAARVW